MHVLLEVCRWFKVSTMVLLMCTMVLTLLNKNASEMLSLLSNHE